MDASLNHHQQAAVQAPEARVLVRAGAGTGKTRVLVARAVRLAEMGWYVRLITFTRAAAREIRARILQLELPDQVERRIQVDTHHGLAAGLLSRHGRLTGSVIDEVEAEAIEKTARARGESPAAIRSRNGLLLYSELIPAALELLASTDAGEDQGGALLVDEGHDSTAEEWRLVNALRPQGLTVVGDGAQRIYGWRGAVALPDGPGWSEYTLSLNYRSTQGILDVANRLKLASPILLRAARGESPGAVQVWHRPDDARTAEDLLWEDLDLNPGGWAVLCRTKDRLIRVRDVLEGAGIPVHAPVLAGQVWDTPEARLLLDHLHAIANAHDSLHLERCMRAAGWDDRRVHLAEAGQARAACSMWDWACANEPADSCAASLLRQLDTFRRNGTSARTCADRFVADPALVRAVPEELSAAEFLRWFADPDRDAGEKSARPDAVHLGTIHGAKGLEWQHVIVLGLEEGSLPLARRKRETRDEDDRLAEERRLAYVAITRAADRLILAHVDQRPSWGRTLDSAPSRFLREAGLLEAACN